MLNKISDSEFESLKQPQPLKLNLNPLEKSQSFFSTLPENFSTPVEISQLASKFPKTS